MTGSTSPQTSPERSRARPSAGTGPRGKSSTTARTPAGLASTPTPPLAPSGARRIPGRELTASFLSLLACRLPRRSGSAAARPRRARSQRAPTLRAAVSRLPRCLASGLTHHGRARRCTPIFSVHFRRAHSQAWTTQRCTPSSNPTHRALPRVGGAGREPRRRDIRLGRFMTTIGSVDRRQHWWFTRP